MRNLKKILALVLALMMVLSTMAVASATSFADDADISAKYEEAVSVLSGIGVIRGVENADGTFSFQPKGNLNRAQAATIIAYVLKGTLDGIDEEVSVYENPFTDVAEWAVPYVLFAHSREIIVGRNETTYDPNATITGYELGKMLLVASGKATGESFMQTVYVVNGVQYTNETLAILAAMNTNSNMEIKSVGKSDWQVLVAKGLKEAEIWNNEFALSKKLTREEACYLAFNTVMNTATIKEGVFGLQVNTDTVDEFGRATKTYTSNKAGLKDTLKVVLDNYVAPSVVVSAKEYNADNESIVAGVNALLGLTKAADKVSGEPVVYLNGDVKTGEATINIGDTVEIYLDKKVVTKVIIIREALVQADVATTAVSSGTNKGLYEVDFGIAKTYAAKGAYTDEAYYLVVANAKGDVLNVENPTVISKAKATKADAQELDRADYMYVNDQKLVKATVCDVLDGAKLGVEYDYALNSNGYLVKVAAHVPAEVVGPTLETGYAYLLAAEKQITTNTVAGSLIGGTGSYAWDVVAVAKLYLTDGTTAIVNLTTEIKTDKDTGVVTELKINGTKMDTLTNDAKPVSLIDLDDVDNDIDLLKAGWVKYTIQEDGSYTLAAVTGTTTVELIKGISDIGDNLFATGATVWTHYEVNTKTGITTTTKTGISGYPAAKEDGSGTEYTAVVTTSKTNGKIVTEFVTFSTYVAPVVENTVENAYFVGAGEYTADGATYDYYVNGTKTNYAASAVPSENGIYTLTLDSKGIIVKVEIPELIKSGKVDYVDDDMFILEDGSVFFFYKTKTYNVSTGHTGEADSIAVGDTIVFTYQEYYEKDEPIVIYITVEKK